QEWLAQNAGIRSEISIAANTLTGQATPAQLIEAAQHYAIATMELEPLVLVTALDGAAADVGIPPFRSRNPDLDGNGVRVAILDSGIDVGHPWLKVAASATTCGESTDTPGPHGTHVAGILASRDATYTGVASGVTLLNIKVANATGRAQPG